MIFFRPASTSTSASSFFDCWKACESRTAAASIIEECKIRLCACQEWNSLFQGHFNISGRPLELHVSQLILSGSSIAVGLTSCDGREQAVSIKGGRECDLKKMVRPCTNDRHCPLHTPLEFLPAPWTGALPP